jgi:hypothetical protein
VIKPYVVAWLDDRCVLRALDTRRGRRKAVLLVDGQAVAVLKLSEADWQDVHDQGAMSAPREEGSYDRSGGDARDNGRGAGKGRARRPGVGLVSARERPSEEPTRAQGTMDGGV